MPIDVKAQANNPSLKELLTDSGFTVHSFLCIASTMRDYGAYPSSVESLFEAIKDDGDLISLSGYYRDKNPSYFGMDTQDDEIVSEFLARKFAGMTSWPTYGDAQEHGQEWYDNFVKTFKENIASYGWSDIYLPQEGAR